MLTFRTWQRFVRLAMLMLAVSLILPTAFGQTALTTAQIAKKASPSVVVIKGRTDSGEVLGSGFIVSKDGKIVTNLHVVRDIKTANVQLADGEVFDSLSVLATDERRDLAVIRVAGFNLPVLHLGNSDTVNIGEPIVIVGSPRGLEGTVTAGILSSIRDSGDGFKVLQTDAAVNPGNSGGPMVNKRGQAIGVVSFKLRSAEGLNFGVPINYLRGMLSALHSPVTLEQMRKGLNPPPRADRNNGPSLKETLDWLRETIPLAAVRYMRYINGHGSLNGTTEAVNVQGAVWSFDSCTVVFGDKTVLETKEHPEWGPSTSIIQNTVRLGSLISWEVERQENGEFRVCSGTAPAPEGGMGQFLGCKIGNFIGAFLESRPPGTWTRWN